MELEMAPSDYTKQMWDKPFLCTFTVKLEDDQLATKMLVENKGEEAFDFQAALHSYFTTSALDNLSIEGSFEGKEFLNKLVGDEGEMQTEDRSVITIGEEYDRVYKGVNDPVLKDSGTGKAVRVMAVLLVFLGNRMTHHLTIESVVASPQLSVLNTAGWEDTVIWNPYGNEGMGYNNFVCVESVKVCSDLLATQTVMEFSDPSHRNACWFLLCSSTLLLLKEVLPGLAKWLSNRNLSEDWLHRSYL